MFSTLCVSVLHWRVKHCSNLPCWHNGWPPPVKTEQKGEIKQSMVTWSGSSRPLLNGTIKKCSKAGCSCHTGSRHGSLADSTPPHSGGQRATKWVYFWVYLYNSELGTRQQCRDNVAMLIVAICLYLVWLLHLDTEALHCFIFFLVPDIL